MTEFTELQPSEDQLQEFESLIRQHADQNVSVSEVRNLHESLGEPWSSMVLSSAQWQKKANEKLGDGLWWLTDRALQQTTPWQVAKRKASWFGDGPICDLCSGIGGDAIHLASRSNVTAVDNDPIIRQMLRRNLFNHAVADGSKDGSGKDTKYEVIGADAGAFQPPPDSWIHIDPDRRVGDKRTSTPDFYSPDWSTTMQIATRARGALVKLAPAAQIDPIIDTPNHRLWISLCGSVREQSLIVGDLVSQFAAQANAPCTSSQHSAITIDRDQSHCIFTGDADTKISTTQKPLEMMVDPDAAIRGAGLTAAFAVEFGLSGIGGASGYLTGPHCDDDRLKQLAICERVIWSGSCDDRKLRRELRSRNLYPKRIKTRGVQHDPNKMEKKLRECGDQPITLWIGRSGKGRYAVFTR